MASLPRGENGQRGFHLPTRSAGAASTVAQLLRAGGLYINSVTMKSIRVADAGRHFMCPVAAHVAMGVGETVNTSALFLWVPAHTL